MRLPWTQEQRNWLKTLGAADAILESAINPDVTPVTGKPPPFAIVASVGRGGRNQKDDVIAVQAELNRKLKLNLELDGKCGSATVGAIVAYQKSIGFKMADGLIEVGGKTATALAGGASGAGYAHGEETAQGAPETGPKQGGPSGVGAPTGDAGAGETGHSTGGGMVKISKVKSVKGGPVSNTQDKKAKADGGRSDMEAARTAAQGSGNTLNNKLQITPNAAAQKCFNEGWKSWDAGEKSRATAETLVPLIDAVSLAARAAFTVGATQFYQQAKAKFSEGLQYL